MTQMIGMDADKKDNEESEGDYNAVRGTKR